MSDTPFFESELFAELKEDLTQSSRFTATYRIAAPDYEEAKKLAFGICVEQTVECPYELVKGTPIGDTIVGQIEDLKKAEPGAYYATISYDPTAVGNEMAELLNMLFGNTSLQPGIKLMSFDLPEAMYDNYPGPRFGRTGLRDLCGVPRGPILMSAIKPLGKSPKELGQMVYDLAMGGCPIIKDDHSLMNQDYAPFEERVLQCVMALADAKEKTGKKSMYIANCTADGLQFLDRAYKAKEIGADGIMAAPAITGFTMIRDLARIRTLTFPSSSIPASPAPRFFPKNRAFPPSATTASSPAWPAPTPSFSPASAAASPSPGKPAPTSAKAPMKNGLPPPHFPHSFRRHEMAALQRHVQDLRCRYHFPRRRRSPDRRAKPDGQYEVLP